MANFDFLTYDKNYSAFSQMAIQAELQYNRNTVFAAFAAPLDIKREHKSLKYSVVMGSLELLSLFTEKAGNWATR